MGEDEVDPDATTVMPMDRREHVPTDGPAVAVKAGSEVLGGTLTTVSLTGQLTVVVDGTLPVDTEVVVRTKGKQSKALESEGTVVWTRSHGALNALGIALSGGDSNDWDRLLG